MPLYGDAVEMKKNVSEPVAKIVKKLEVAARGVVDHYTEKR